MHKPLTLKGRARRAAAGKVTPLVCAVLLALAATAWAQPPAPPPLIDRQLFFGDPEIVGGRLSPDGKHIAFIKPLDGTRNVWVKGIDEPFEAARPITAETKRPIPVYLWSQDGKLILYVQDQGGDENFNVYAVDPAAPPAAGQRVPAARNVTAAKGARAFVYAVPKTDPDTIYVGLNDRDPAWHDLYKVKLSTGERTLLRKNTERLTGWVFDRKDQLRLATRSAENGDTEVLRVDGDGFKKVYSCNVFETCSPVGFHKDGRRVYMMTNKGDVDLARLVLFDPKAGSEEPVEADPMNRVDFGDAVFSDRTNDLIATVYVDDQVRIYWKDKGFETDYELLKQKLPGKEINFGSLTKDERLALVSATSDTEPGETYLFDRSSKQLTLQYRIREQLPRPQLAAMKAIRYKSSDGLEIPAYLTLPKGLPATNLPLVVVPHGGPWARDVWGYNPLAQFLANRGYAVLEPNFRASTGYGKKFLNAGNDEWGQKMQDDLTWGVKHLVAEGIADPRRVGILGGSYGGYATLAGLAFTPDVYAAGVSIVGPSNLITLLNSIPPYWEQIRKIFNERMGDPSTPQGRAQLDRQSPLNSADKIKAPLLVVQGANDPRVNKAESDQIVVALRERGFPVEYVVAPDEGHGFARPVNNLAMFAAAEKFLAKHLGGHYQESMTPEVATRLAEISVDVKTVQKPHRLAASAATPPKPAADLKPGTTSYKASLEIGGQTIPMTVTREVKEEGDRWVVTEIAKLSMGDITDKTVFAKGTLVSIERSVHQGPLTVELAFKDGKATGTMTVNGQARPVATDLGGDLFADGAGGHLALAALPLTAGYAATYLNFDVQAQKMKLLQMKVAGAEKITVPAGTFDSLKLEVTSAEGEAGTTTIWIDPATRQELKSVAVLPQMNGAVLTTELTQ
ncbi:MAG: S9 family peptidase [Acidobacteria bacterium]|nr:S9 family peptidase [Acidobacteriota bacterium]